MAAMLDSVVPVSSRIYVPPLEEGHGNFLHAIAFATKISPEFFSLSAAEL